MMATTFADALVAYRQMREDGSLDGAIRSTGLDPEGLMETLAEVAATDASPAEAYVLALLAGYTLGSLDGSIFVADQEALRAAAAQVAEDVKSEMERRGLTGPTDSTEPTRGVRPGLRRPGR